MSSTSTVTKKHSSTLSSHPVPGGLRSRRISAGSSFWVMIAVYVGLMAAAAAPSPIYVLYQAQWDISESTVTMIYGAYALALVITLLTIGGLSDFIGRKPVLLAGFAALTLSMVVFALADGVVWLYAARILQGLAAGALLGAVSAGLLDFAGQKRLRFAVLANGLIPSLGLAFGALLAGALAQWVAAPTRLVYIILAVAFVIGMAAIAAGPETEARRPGALASLSPRIRIAKNVRPQFLAQMPAWFATWAQLGLTLALTTSLAAVKFGITDLFLGALVVVIICLAASVANFVLRDAPARLSTLLGSGALILGTAVTLISLIGPWTVLFYLGSTLGGLGIGAMMGATIRALSAMPQHSERAEFFAGAYMIGYVALSVPAIIAGFCAVHVGLVDVTIAYGIGVSLLALVAAAFALRPVGVAISPV
ncbi:MAG: transporter [Pseudonocardiales bacterium]|nr:transporter [Pseudonocardiales bacterium]